MNKLDPKALAFAIGISWASGIFFLGILSMFGIGNHIVEIISNVYIGYSSTVKGIIIGTIWAFLDGAIGGLIIAWIYNLFVR